MSMSEKIDTEAMNASLTAFVTDMENKRMEEIIARRYKIYLGHPEAIKIATQSLPPKERKYSIFIENKYLRKDKMALLQDINTKIQILKSMGLI